MNITAMDLTALSSCEAEAMKRRIEQDLENAYDTGIAYALKDEPTFDTCGDDCCKVAVEQVIGTVRVPSTFVVPESE